MTSLKNLSNLVCAHFDSKPLTFRWKTQQNELSLLGAEALLSFCSACIPYLENIFYFSLFPIQEGREEKTRNVFFQHLISVIAFEDVHAMIKISSSFVSNLWRKSAINRVIVHFYFTFICTGIENEQQGRPQVLKQ